MNRFIDRFHPDDADIALCGSMAHKDQWLNAVDQLQAQGLTVHIPDMSESVDWTALSDQQVIEKKNYFIDRHLANIAASKAVLICNYEKNGEAGYIGTNVLMEITAAYLYDKPIYLLNDVDIEGKGREVLALRPTILHGDLDKLIEIMKEK